MLYTIPDYYKKFKCTADACEDTCCAGWQIVIDRKSLKNYHAVRGNLRRWIRSSIDWKKGVFKQDSSKRCAFLNEQNLCNLYTALGEKSLCRTCTLYPRHIEEFEGVREISLSVSCPEVAKLLLSTKEPVNFLSYQKPGEEEYEDFDIFLYSKLADAREVILKILQNRSLSIPVRAGAILAIAHDMQARISRGELFSCDEVLEKYQKTSALEFVTQKCVHWEADSANVYQFSKQQMQKLYNLELLKDSWFITLKETEHYLYQSKKQPVMHYTTISDRFQQWCSVHLPTWDIWCEQLLVYFIFTYFCGAVYDGRVYAKVQMAVYSMFIICEMLKARWAKNEEYLDLEDVIDIVYRYSRELEHSDENLKKLEKMMEKNRWICI